MMILYFLKAFMVILGFKGLDNGGLPYLGPLRGALHGNPCRSWGLMLGLPWNTLGR